MLALEIPPGLFVVTKLGKVLLIEADHSIGDFFIEY